MKKKGLLIGIIILVIAVAVGLYSYNRVDNINKQNELIDEINAISDIADQEYYDDVDRDALYEHLNSRISSGKYGIVEDCAKKYLTNFFDDIFAAVDELNDEQLQNILTAENIAEDGPDFTETKALLANKKAAAENAKADYEQNLSQEAIDSYIKDAGLKDSYVEFYHSLLNYEETEDNNNYIKSIDEIIESITKLENAVNFLSENKDSWKLDGDNIMFYDQSLLNEYNQLCAEL